VHLVLRVSWRELAWRGRLDLARKHAPTWAEAMPGLEPALEQVGLILALTRTLTRTLA
jgi:hypothetical protein